ncbi:MAG: LysR family transcriptional regulator [Paracoccus sp. (in: a-proteobacteria)]|uniref:LysR family transcriptional regulator n=1 Tax=Paracoccus sp. TaxID=267 RepID=UPI0026DFC753|nr:LysR family transcriptional regulator [Paracoccus sp. (in: a-proteobacteria)]MDO5630663.1 LysR family transcriptional regulator [Paracoccus sp. (in: a-proteobacteria)]
MDNWDDIRVALAVAREGTISGAATVLGVHHATVIRRIDALEAALGVRLFQRGARGYTPTEEGQVLLESGSGIEERVAQMHTRIRGGGAIEGVLTVTALPDMHWLILPRLAPMLAAHPGLRLDYQTDARLFRLGAGEAHVAIRGATVRPSEPDYVVQPFLRLRMALFAAPDLPLADDLARNRFVLPGDIARRAPYMPWVQANVRSDAQVLTANEPSALRAAIGMGLGVGFLYADLATGLVEIAHNPEWDSILWLVTHVDLHRSPKVQAALAALKSGR